MSRVPNIVNDLYEEMEMRVEAGLDIARIPEIISHIEALEKEIKFLRQYGNKDCIAMADEALAESERVEAEEE